MIYDVGKACKKGHTTGRYVVSRKCIQCAKDAAMAWNKANPDRFNASLKKYRSAHPERISEQGRSWRTKNPARVKANNDRWQNANKEKFLGISSSWKRRNRPHVNAKVTERRLMQIQRTPAWLTDEDRANIKKFYELAAELTKAYGSPWHVDHIIPLRGKIVSGLHVPWNLQVLPASVNVRKGNRFNG